MSLLIQLSKKGTMIIHPVVMKLCPDFAYLSGKEMLAIILCYDHYSIFRQFPEDERKRRSRAHVFGIEQETFFESPKIKKAVEMYKSLQYDQRRNQLITYKKKMDAIDSLMEETKQDDFSQIKTLIGLSKELRKAISELEQEIDKEEEDNSLIEDDQKNKLSFLERLQSNVERYKQVTTKKEIVK